MDTAKTTEQSEEEWWDDFGDFRPYAHNLRDAHGREKSIWLPMMFTLVAIEWFGGSYELFFAGLFSGIVISAIFLFQFSGWRAAFGIIWAGDREMDGEEPAQADSDEQSGPRLIREGGE